MSAAITFMKNLNRRAIIREYLLNFYQNVSIPTSIESMIILSSTINQLTDTRSEWTRVALVIVLSIRNSRLIISFLEYHYNDFPSTSRSSL